MFCLFLSPLWHTKKLSALIRSKPCLFSQWQKNEGKWFQSYTRTEILSIWWLASCLSVYDVTDFDVHMCVVAGGGKGECFIATSELPTVFCILPICPNSLTNSCDRELSHFLLVYSATDGTRSTKVQHENRPTKVKRAPAILRDFRGK